MEYDDTSGLGFRPQSDARSNRLKIFDQYRGLLFSIAYRMLGSVADAEDMLRA